MFLRRRSHQFCVGPSGGGMQYPMRAAYRAATALLVAFVSIAGPVSAASSSGTLVAQATQSATIQGHVNGSSSAGLGGAAVTLDGRRKLRPPPMRGR
jgi:hypothetical protein